MESQPARAETGFRTFDNVLTNHYNIKDVFFSERVLIEMNDKDISQAVDLNHWVNKRVTL